MWNTTTKDPVHEKSCWFKFTLAAYETDLLILLQLNLRQLRWCKGQYEDLVAFVNGSTGN